MKLVSEVMSVTRSPEKLKVTSGIPQTCMFKAGRNIKKNGTEEGVLILFVELAAPFFLTSNKLCIKPRTI